MRRNNQGSAAARHQHSAALRCAIYILFHVVHNCSEPISASQLPYPSAWAGAGNLIGGGLINLDSEEEFDVIIYG